MTKKLQNTKPIFNTATTNNHTNTNNPENITNTYRYKCTNISNCHHKWCSILLRRKLLRAHKLFEILNLVFLSLDLFWRRRITVDNTAEKRRVWACKQGPALPLKFSQQPS
jgi:hypothetical protein